MHKSILWLGEKLGRALIFSVSLLWLICRSQMILAESPSAAPDLTGVEADFDQRETLINAQFSGRLPFSKVSVESHGTFLHISLPGVAITESGKFYPAKGPYVSKIAAFQFSPQNSAVRLFVKKDAKLLSGALATDILNDRLIISIDHKALEKAGISDHLANLKQISSKEIIAKTEVRRDIKDPASAVASTSQQVDSDGAVIKEKMVIITCFLAAFMVLAFIVYYLKKRMKTHHMFKGDQGATVMKSLGTYSLAPKKNLTLMQVGQQKILLGVSSEGINFLTNIEEKSSVDSIIPPKRPQTLQEPSQEKFQRLLAAKANASKPKLKKPVPEEIPKKKTPKIAKKNRDLVKPQEESKEKDVALQDVTSLIRQKLKDLPRI